MNPNIRSSALTKFPENVLALLKLNSPNHPFVYSYLFYYLVDLLFYTQSFAFTQHTILTTFFSLLDSYLSTVETK